MIGKIFKYEFKLLKADFSIIILLFSFIILFSFFNSSYKVNNNKQLYQSVSTEQNNKLAEAKNEAVEMEKEMMKNDEALNTNRTGVRSPSNIGTKGLSVVFKPDDFSIIAIGQYDLYPVNYVITNSGKDSSIKNIENPFTLYTGNFDPTFVILYLYPIFIIILSFDLIASEKEKNVLKILLTQSITLNSLVLGKIAVRAVLIFGTVILVSLLGMIFSGLNIVDNLSKIAIYILTVIIYGSFWFGLCILVNSLKNKAVTNAMIMSITWLIFLLIIPSVINLSVNLIYPIPSRIKYVDDLTQASEQTRLEGSKILGKFMEDHPELVDKKIDTSKVSVLKAMRDAEIIKKVKPINDLFNAQIDKQQNFINLFKYLSPAIITQEIMYDLSETGLTAFNNYNKQTNQFQESWRNFFVSKIFASEPVYAKDYDNIPTFEYKNIEINTIVAKSLISLIYLLFLTLIIYFISRSKYKSYSVID